VVAGAGVEVLPGIVDKWGGVGVERDKVCSRNVNVRARGKCRR
jgi:hypothetical protein